MRLFMSIIDELVAERKRRSRRMKYEILLESHGMYHIPNTISLMVYTLILSNSIDDMLRSDYEFSSHPYRIHIVLDELVTPFVIHVHK
jgi:hypothetical protein